MAIRDFLSLNAQVWYGIPPNVAAHAALAGKITDITLLVELQGAVIAGLTASKAEKRRALEG